MPNPEGPAVLDLFSGAGGMALGFEAAGARCIGAVEKDTRAAETFASMFSHTRPLVLGGPEEGDANKIHPEELAARLPEAPDLIVGGPPCQGFSRVGRAKQRSLLDEASRQRQGGVTDPDRNELYHFFLDMTRVLRPKAFVMENVPGIRHVMGVDVARRIAMAAEQLGYNVRYFLLNAAWYGVPQHRWRIFFIGLRSDLGPSCIPTPPPRTHDHHLQMPEGFNIPEDHRMKWGPGIPARPDLLPVVSTREALGDLPRFKEHLTGTKPVEQRLPYRRRPSTWAQLMRRWPGREPLETVSGNWHRFTPRDFPIFREMASGDRYPEALLIANRRFQERLAEASRRGEPIEPGSHAYKELRKATIPPYRNDAFMDKWHKLIPTRPSWTLPAHLSKDTYSHIHYDSTQARMITVREAARLQSFPDAFEFQGNMGDRFRQIGNAVPPLLARAIAKNLLAQLQEIEDQAGEQQPAPHMTRAAVELRG